MQGVGYIRVSTDDQAKEGVSLEAQRAKIEAWCLANETPLNPADVFVEGEGIDRKSGRGKSGSRADNRPALQAALNRVCSCRGVLVFSSLSRLARSTRDTLDISDRLHKAGANMVSLTERIDTTSASGKMVFSMLAVLNQFERDQVSDRTCEVLQHKIRKGERCGKVRFGFVVDPDDPRRSKMGLPAALVVAPEEMEAISLMKNLKAEGKSLRFIAAELTRREIPTREGRPAWHHSTVKQILARHAIPPSP